MASPAITPKKAERIAKKAAEAVLSHQGHVVIQANTPEMLPGLTGQKVVGLWPKLRADIEKRARNTDPKSHKTLIELLRVPVHPYSIIGHRHILSYPFLSYYTQRLRRVDALFVIIYYF